MAGGAMMARFDLEIAARKQNDGQRNAPPSYPPDFFALTVDPSS